MNNIHDGGDSIDVNSNHVQKCVELQPNDRGYFYDNYPVELMGLIDPQEFSGIITRFNSLAASWRNRLPLIGVACAMLATIVLLGVFGSKRSLIGIVVTAIIIVALCIILYLQQSIYRDLKKSKMNSAIEEANKYFEDRQITFSLQHRHSSNRYDWYIKLQTNQEKSTTSSSLRSSNLKNNNNFNSNHNGNTIIDINNKINDDYNNNIIII
ncbi:hypothetical protein PPL_10135 [Heterostelium album PN500]|uniref:Uncharacterized protein n=1 Tax=Heterostelium pallidum (strain ATCC 26659 / Pp 5 / PN500) TaxID=670386 RepID=D3BQF0_HETP5|nr:hypothetical protein PPL_10135 [Heterostelium album PN500]EFA76370.1 hypothetical protein PPL_10135 [Heterostelium album PN500]|eukprot:XP_020428502.1 hypothetical protein PPL_10135 [Heterostelium album PN500]